jgi:hypothetical protein
MCNLNPLGFLYCDPYILRLNLNTDGVVHDEWNLSWTEAGRVEYPVNPQPLNPKPLTPQP